VRDPLVKRQDRQNAGRARSSLGHTETHGTHNTLSTIDPFGIKREKEEKEKEKERLQRVLTRKCRRHNAGKRRFPLFPTPFFQAARLFLSSPPSSTHFFCVSSVFLSFFLFFLFYSFISFFVALLSRGSPAVRAGRASPPSSASATASATPAKRLRGCGLHKRPITLNPLAQKISVVHGVDRLLRVVVLVVLNKAVTLQKQQQIVSKQTRFLPMRGKEGKEWSEEKEKGEGLKGRGGGTKGQTLTKPVWRSKFRCKLLISPKSANLSRMWSSVASSWSPVTKMIHPSTAANGRQKEEEGKKYE